MSARVRILIFITLLSLMLCFLGGCSSYSKSGVDSEFYGGELLMPEDVQSIVDAVSAAQTEKYPTETDIFGWQIVFWVDGGTVWHVSRQCTSVKKATTVHEGSKEDAIAAGKERPCSICTESE